jgi:predicted enzyme related to lactoylglutathione lyase
VQPTTSESLFRSFDWYLIPVPDLEAGLAFYRDRLGHALVWRRPTAAGLRLRDTGAQIVLTTDLQFPETDFLVDSTESAVRTFVEAGGSLVCPPFDIPTGRCAAVKDPWGNCLIILDQSKGSYVVEQDGSVRHDAAGDPMVESAPSPGEV